MSMQAMDVHGFPFFEKGTAIEKSNSSPFLLRNISFSLSVSWLCIQTGTATYIRIFIDQPEQFWRYSMEHGNQGSFQSQFVLADPTIVFLFSKTPSALFPDESEHLYQTSIEFAFRILVEMNGPYWNITHSYNTNWDHFSVCIFQRFQYFFSRRLPHAWDLLLEKQAIFPLSNFPFRCDNSRWQC